jgi:hypothetical protein
MLNQKNLQKHENLSIPNNPNDIWCTKYLW